jgi:hypothetical protein
MASQRPRSVTVSEKDREYFRRLGEWEAENERMEQAAHDARTLEERLIWSEGLTRRLGRTLHAIPGDDNGTAAMKERAIRLGLYRP